MTVSWDAVSGADGYDVRTKTGSADWAVAASNATGTTVAVNILEVPDYVGVRALAGSEASAWTDVSRLPPPDLFERQPSGGAGAQAAQAQAQAQNKLPAPANVKVVRSNGGTRPTPKRDESLTVTWDAVAGATGYRIACNYLSYNNWRKCGKDNSNNWKSHRTTAGTTGVTVSHLDGPTDNANTGSWERMTFGSEYSVIVQAMNGSAAGTWSAPFDARPAYPIYLMSGEGVPPSYQILNASKRTVTGFTLAWTQPYRASGYAAECVEIVGGQESGSWTKCSEDANVFSEKQVSGASVTTDQAQLYGWHINDRIITGIAIEDLDLDTAGKQALDPWKYYDVRVRTTNPAGKSDAAYPPISVWEPYYTSNITNVSKTGATIEIGGHTGNWWHKSGQLGAGAASQQTGCAGPVSGALTLTGLTGASHTLDAYSDAACDDEDKIMSRTISLVDMSAGSITRTSAVLTLKPYAAKWHLGRIDSNGNSSGCVPVPAPSSGGSVSAASVSGLTPGAAYRYGAHSDAACRKRDLIDRVSFSTLSAEMTAGDIASASATLTLAGHTGNWWLKRTAPTVGNCFAGEADHSHALSNLDSAATQTFTAYDASGCAAADSIASETFTTQGFAVVNVSLTSATLKLTGHIGGWWYKANTGPDNSCKSAGSVKSKALSGLTSGASYTYTAYSASGCASANEIASETFTMAGYSVGNLSKSAVSGDSCTVGFSKTQRKCAASFTTGSRSGGYTLVEVAAKFLEFPGEPGDIIVAIHAADDGTPANPSADELVRLTGPNPSEEEDYAYVCPANSLGCGLDADETYFVVMSTTKTGGESGYYRLAVTTADDEDKSPSNNGWSIANDSRAKNGANAWRQLSAQNGYTGMIGVVAKNAETRFYASNIAAETATLNLSGRSGNWWYKANAGPDNACQGPETGASKDLSGLTSGSPYTYTAYSASGCAAANEIAYATFKTLPTLTSSAITTATATLTLSGRAGSWWLKPASGACAAGEPDYSHALAGLTPGASHTYKAYSDSTCETPIATETFTTTSAAPDATGTPELLAPGNGQLTVSWAAPAANGSDILDYDVRYRKKGAGAWTDSRSLATYNGNRTAKSSNGSTGDALDMGGVGLSGIGVTRPALSGVSDVYKLGAAAGALRVSVELRIGYETKTWRAAYASTAPTSSNMNSHGNTIWQKTGTGTQFNGDGWTGPLPANTYFWVARTSGGTNANVNATVQGELVLTNAFHTITGLTNGSEYEVQTRAGNALGDSAWSASATLKAGLPSAPTPALESGVARLTATWAAPSGNGSAITGYDVQHCRKGCDNDVNWTNWAHTGTSATATITGLTNGDKHQVRVRSINSVGAGPWSPRARLAAGAPAAPAAPKLRSDDEGLTASWTAPANNGSAITDYDVRYRAKTAPAPAWKEWNAANAGVSTTASITGLTNNAEYEVQVRAANARGDGAWSPSTANTPGKPQAPNLTLTAGKRQIGANWIIWSNGLSITGYDVEYCSANCDTETNWNEWTHSGLTPMATITGLTHNVAYKVRVRGASSAGDGPWSAEKTATPTADKPDAPAAPQLGPGNQQIHATWTAPYNGGSAITDYDIQYCSTNCDDAANWTDWTHTGTSATATITGLTNGTTYQAQTRAENAHGESPWSASGSIIAGTPSKIAAPTLAAGERKLTVSWTAPANNGSAITDYDVHYRQTGTTSWTRVFDGGSGGRSGHQFGVGEYGSSNDPIDYGGLGNSNIAREQFGSKWGLYKINNAIDEMETLFSARYSPQFNIWKMPSKPTAGTDLTNPGGTATKIGTSGGSGADHKFHGWLGPFDAGDYFWMAPLSGQSGHYKWFKHTMIKNVDLATTTTSYEITGLTAGVSYDARVRASNSFGDGDWSATTAATPTAP